ncbi:outer membrane beta-barrel protein [Dyadobacter endophyticus]|uniref:Outer membrane protein beta-barrel domain-containing protein n=1 Tax=Dyadobacter endophyticus TaxID=1749036 RepID=A0ABQ1YVU6_9BACT|nr:outer membrane beta-barrel protein [Dyadobacter endophyticus]GGH38571.1 hypothetical protein GCM10007423_32370 [Dyadobacter endophyticus]
MKNITFLVLAVLTCVSGGAFAQYEGKRFLTGSLSLDFNNTNPDISKATHSYGYNVSTGIGRFKSNTRANVWNLSTSLRAGKGYLTDNSGETTTISGISSVGFGVGHAWQFYKHFNDKVGVFASLGPDLSYLYGKQRENNENYSWDVKSHAFSLSLGVSAGAYYRLDERWWLTASIGFAQPVAVQFTRRNTQERATGARSHSNQLNYGFSPSITLPSVGLGLRYFLKD